MNAKYVVDQESCSRFFQLAVYSIQKYRSISAESDLPDLSKLSGSALFNPENILTAAMRMQDKPKPEYIDAFNLATMINRADLDIVLMLYASEYGLSADVTNTETMQPWGK